MKKLAIIAAAMLTLSSCGILQGINWNEEALASATGKIVTAASITDDQIIQLCQQSIAQMDAEAIIDNGTYAKRLARLMNGVNSAGDLPVNFKVYKKDEINAFACGDGSVRVYTGLMDVMNDEQLVAIIGHELGHLCHQDTKKAMKKAYMTSAARDAVASVGTVGAIASSMLGDISEAFLQAQFSQKQEFAADEFGYEFAVYRGCSPYAMAQALEKLVELNNGQQASAVAQMFASHPNSEVRAAKMRAKADEAKAAAQK